LAGVFDHLQTDAGALADGFEHHGRLQPAGQGALGESNTAKRAVGTPVRQAPFLVNTLSKATRLASGPQPV
jgi:hypothetical protein